MPCMWSEMRSIVPFKRYNLIESEFFQPLDWTAKSFDTNFFQTLVSLSFGLKRNVLRNFCWRTKQSPEELLVQNLLCMQIETFGIHRNHSWNVTEIKRDRKRPWCMYPPVPPASGEERAEKTTAQETCTCINLVVQMALWRVVIFCRHALSSLLTPNERTTTKLSINIYLSGPKTSDAVVIIILFNVLAAPIHIQFEPYCLFCYPFNAHYMPHWMTIHSHFKQLSCHLWAFSTSL